MIQLAVTSYESSDFLAALFVSGVHPTNNAQSAMF